MRTLAIVHQPDAGAGVFGEAAAERGTALDVWMPADEARPPREPAEYGAVMAFGGAMHADQDDVHPWMGPEKELLAGLLEGGIPVLGVCLGSQLLAAAAGARPARAAQPEIGWLEVELTAAGREDPLFGILPGRFEAFQWHSYASPPPPGAAELATSPLALQAFRIGDAAWGIQFHAEVTRADARHWIDDYEADPDAVRIGIDPAALWAETEPRIEAWNDLGRRLGARFLELAERRSRDGTAAG